MHINDNFFSFPPYLSTSWEHVSALSLNKDHQIVVHMNSGDSIALPELSTEETKFIFTSHAHFLENQALSNPIKQQTLHSTSKEIIESHEFPIRFAFGGMEGLNSAMQHNPSQKNAPNLPDEMLLKIAEVSRILAPTDPEQLPKPEPHCNCYHCQIARALLGIYPQKEVPHLEEGEEEVLMDDLQFEQWDITQTGDKLFNVANKLDLLESYSVHLGNPVGCTCGKQDCEHILAVLKS